LEDPRKIDSTWHIPPGSGKRELGLSQLTQSKYAVWKEVIAKVGLKKVSWGIKGPEAGGCQS
jgi:hypothetical protein